MMLVTRRALDVVLADLSAAADACAALVERYREAIEPGRTLLQQALPLTFGLKAARVAGRPRRRGRGAARGSRARACVAVRRRGRHLGEPRRSWPRRRRPSWPTSSGCPRPICPWHTIRLRPARIASRARSGARGDGQDRTRRRAARADRGGRGRPRAAARVAAAPRRCRTSATRSARSGSSRARSAARAWSRRCSAAMMQEHERGAGTWQAEWETLPALLRLTGSAAAIARELLAGLEVDAEKMRSDMDLTGGLVMSESVAAALAPALGRADAQDLVEKAARRSVESGRPFREVLLELPEVAESLGPDGLDAALDPAVVSRGHGRADRPSAGGAPCRLSCNYEFRRQARLAGARVHRVARHRSHDVGAAGGTARASASARFATTSAGHGSSPVPPGPYSIADLGGDLLALLDRLGIERASLCGLSIGGMISMWVAAHAPERVERLVLCCTSAQLGPRDGLASSGPRPSAPRASGRSPTRCSVAGSRAGFARGAPGRDRAHAGDPDRDPPRGLRRLLRGDRGRWTCARDLPSITRAHAGDRRRARIRRRRPSTAG